MSNFKEDIKSEKLMAKWLDKYFYKKLNQKEISYKRVDELNQEHRVRTAQKMGVDMMLKNKHLDMYYIDEKAQLLYLNNPLPTFAFEIQYEKNREIKKGGYLIKIKRQHIIY